MKKLIEAARAEIEIMLGGKSPQLDKLMGSLQRELENHIRIRMRNPSMIRDEDYHGYGTCSGHRNPYQAGGADAYYHRPCEPNFDYHGARFDSSQMSAEQVAEYRKGYREEGDRKQWDDIIVTDEHGGHDDDQAA